MLKLRLLRLQQRGASRLTTPDFVLARLCAMDSRGMKARNDLTPHSLPVFWYPGRLQLAAPGLAGVEPPRACTDTPGAPLPGSTLLGRLPCWWSPPCWAR